MSGSKIMWIVIVLSIVAFLVFRIEPIKQTAVELCLPEGMDVQMISEDDLLKTDEPASFLTQKDGFLERLNKNLEKKGYAFQLLVSVYSIQDIRVKLLLENKSATDFVHREITTVFNESVKESNLDSRSFTLDISDAPLE